MNSTTKKTIFVAPLNWGLGHATRCIPIINALLKNGFNVLIGSDGNALQLFKHEFPELPFIELPSYNISYPENGNLFKVNMFLKLPQLYIAAKKEKQVVKKLVAENRIQGIISDNRLGLSNKKITSVYMTHQLQVLTGVTTAISSKAHQNYIKKFDACWVPDYKNEPSLSGIMGHVKKLEKMTTYIGPISRMNFEQRKKEYDILIILSGPEPQRSLLETLLLEKFSQSNRKVLLVKGRVGQEQQWTTNGTIKAVNYLTTADLQKAINESEVVLCRSGYTSIMDLAALNKKTFFIPTPGQYEQEYLAKRLDEQNRIPYCNQEDFEVSKLSQIGRYSGWKTDNDFSLDFKQLFDIF